MLDFGEGLIYAIREPEYRVYFADVLQKDLKHIYPHLCVACQCCVRHYPRVCLGKANKLSTNLATSAPRVRANRAAAAEGSLQQTSARPSDEPRIIAPWQEHSVILILRCVLRRLLLLPDVRRSERNRRCAQTQQAHRSQRERRTRHSHRSPFR